MMQIVEDKGHEKLVYVELDQKPRYSALFGDLRALAWEVERRNGVKTNYATKKGQEQKDGIQ
jgi:hypothetical protein